MLWKFISENYSPNEPIIASDIDLGLSDVNRRQQFKILTDEGKLKRYENGVYYIPQESFLGGEVPVLPDQVIGCKYVTRRGRVFGYYSGYTLANLAGITTQMPALTEIVTNEIGSPMKRIEKDCRKFLVRKSRTEITADNVRVLQFLDLLKETDRYAELQGEALTKCFEKFINTYGITKSQFDMYLPLYPEKIYRIIYETGVSNVLA